MGVKPHYVNGNIIQDGSRCDSWNELERTDGGKCLPSLPSEENWQTRCGQGRRQNLRKFSIFEDKIRAIFFSLGYGRWALKGR